MLCFSGRNVNYSCVQSIHTIYATCSVTAKKDHITELLFIIYCYNHFTWLFIIAVNLLMCLTYELNFVEEVYIQEKQHAQDVSCGGLRTLP